jgi:DNA-binding NarL/FixJ family response regulator
MNDSVRVFIVEDSAALRERIVGDIVALGRFDIVGWAESQNEAVESIALLAPDVVVTDLRLKEGSGVEVLRRVREKRPMPPPSIVVLTNYATLEYKQRCFDFGADEFFDKTSEYDEFLQRMRAVAPQLPREPLRGDGADH